MNETKNSPKPKSGKDSRIEENKSAETLDKHPKPVNNKAETPHMTSMQLIRLIDIRARFCEVLLSES